MILLVKHHYVVFMFRIFKFVNVRLFTGLKTGLHGSSQDRILKKIAFYLKQFWRDNVFVKLKMFLVDIQLALMCVHPLSGVGFLPWWRCSCFPETHTGLNTTGSRWCWQCNCNSPCTGHTSRFQHLRILEERDVSIVTFLQLYDDTD